MSKIRLDADHTLVDGESLTFNAPCACNNVDGIKVYYPNDSGAETSKAFCFTDAHGNDLTGLGNLFDSGAYVKVILDTVNGRAFIQNGDTNAYLENKISSASNALNAHIDNQNNPHKVTAAQIGAAAASHSHATSDITGLQDALNTNATAIQNHTNNKSNPHGVTAEQIGAISAEIHLWKASVLDVCGYVLADALSKFEYTTTVTFKYSDKIASDGVKLSLVNPSSQVVASTTYTKATVIAGKFVLIDSKIYHVPSNGVTTTSSKRTVNCYEVTATYTPSEDLGTVTSTDPNAYPQNASKDGVYYEYLGKLGDILVNYGARICTGSYEGTGTYGEDNPMSIVFPFVPKFVMIGSYHGNEAMFNLTKLRDGAYVPHGYHRCVVSNTAGQLTLDDAQYATINGKTLSFYSTATAESQINISGEHYEWFAIG